MGPKFTSDERRCLRDQSSPLRELRERLFACGKESSDVRRQRIRALECEEMTALLHARPMLNVGVETFSERAGTRRDVARMLGVSEVHHGSQSQREDCSCYGLEWRHWTRCRGGPRWSRCA